MDLSDRCLQVRRAGPDLSASRGVGVLRRLGDYPAPVLDVRRYNLAGQAEADGLGSWARRRWTREVLLRYNAAHRSICFIVPSARSVME
jgi:hypothetical protein